MGRFAIGCIGLIAVARLAVAAPEAGPSHTFTGRDVFDLQWVEDPQIRPDGHAVAYVRMSYDIMTDRPKSTLWLMDLDSGVQTPLASGPGSNGSPRWSPDGKRLAYVSSAEGGQPQLFVRWMQTGLAARITDLTEAPADLSWSPDGRSIAFIMLMPEEKAKLGEAPAKPEGAHWADPLTVITDVNYRADGAGYLTPGFSHAFVVSADGGAPRQLTFGAYNDEGPISWTPDSRDLLLSGNRSENWRLDPVTSQIYRVSVADANLTELTHRSGPFRQARVSPDGSKIAFLGFEDHYMGYQDVRVYLMDRDGQNAHSISDGLDRSVEELDWAADGRSLYIQYVDKAVTKVARLGLNGHLDPVAEGLTGGELDRPYTGGKFSVSQNGTVAYSSGDPTHPEDLAVVRGGHVMRLTHLNDELFTVRKLGEVRPLAVTSSFDKRPIDAWLVLPPNFAPGKKYPLILEIHGGPFASYGPVFSTDDQLYAAAGYVVLYANPRGSTSYGEEFANLIQYDYPDHDYDDLMSVVDAAIDRGAVDTNNLFVTGGSGGGILTAWTVGSTHRFRAASSQAPVVDWASWVVTSDVYAYVERTWFKKSPWDDHETYWRQSPLSRVDKVTTPTLMIVGDQDLRTTFAQAEAFYQALQLTHTPTSLVVVPGAGHGVDRPSQYAAEINAILAWFDRYKQVVSP